MIRRFCLTLSILLSLTALAAATQAAEAAKAREFVFTAIPDEDESRLRQRFDMVAAYLSKKLGIKTRYIPVKSYAAAVTAFRNNQVQLAWFGGLSGVRARLLVPGSQALAQGLEDRSFVTYFIAHAKSGLKPGAGFPMGIAGKTFTFGSKGSTSGRLIPEFHIRKHLKKAPSQVFPRVGFSGNHSRTIALVQSGAYMAGAVNFKVWENEMRAGRIDKSKIAVIWKTPPYPDYHWTLRGDAEVTFWIGFNRDVKRALVLMTDPKLLASFPRKRFVPAKNSDFNSILRIGKSIGLID